MPLERPAHSFAVMLQHLGELFAFNVSPWEIIARGTLMYLFLFVVFRFSMRRGVGAVGLADVLVLVLIADAAQNAMAGDYNTVAEGGLLVLTIIGWNALFDWLAYRFPAFERFAEPRSLTLVRNGRILQPNLRRSLMTQDELRSKLREHGVQNVSDVKAARLESDGEVTVIANKGKTNGDKPPKKKTVAG
jgi:uncharacterized membrane protein YcaP (DUF421 family)